MGSPILERSSARRASFWVPSSEYSAGLTVAHPHQARGHVPLRAPPKAQLPNRPRCRAKGGVLGEARARRSQSWGDIFSG